MLHPDLPDGLAAGSGALETYVSLICLLTAASPVASIIHAAGHDPDTALVTPVLDWSGGRLMLVFLEDEAPEPGLQTLVVWTLSALVPPELWPFPPPRAALGGYLHVSLCCSWLESVGPQRFWVKQALVQGNLGELASADLCRVVQGLRLHGDDAQRAAAEVFSAWQRYATCVH